ncbi:MAG: helix-turn-helix transcriptional regulator [Acidobacteriota bacterium]|nr:MAG: helix-turn-helix transcriptional regulator [Acidobacteriota bacterium]
MENEIVKTISAIYDAAYDETPDSWVIVCEKIDGLLDAENGGVTVLDTVQKEISVVGSRMDPELLAQYVEHYQYRNPIQDRIAGLRSGGRFNRAEAIADEDFEKLEITNEFFSKGRIFHFEYRVIAAPDDLHAAIQFSRPRGRGNFAKKDLELMDLLMPHLGRAFGIHFNFLKAKQERSILAEVLDRMPRGVFVVNEARKVLYSNTSGNSILTDGDGIYINRRGGISVRNNSDHKRFKAALAGVFTSPGINSGWAATIRLNRGTGKRPLELLLAKCTKGDCDQFGTGEKAIIFVSDPESKRVSVADVLCRLYGLTRSEARIAGMIADGMSMADISDELCIAESTVKTHLKRIFSKTDTRRQSELAKLVLLGPASLRFDGERKV